MKIVIVGGVAGGAGAAARLRRLDESAEIVLIERGEFISFANCGLPYHIGKIIPERGSLLVTTPRTLMLRSNIKVRTRQEVTAIRRGEKRVCVHKLDSGERYEESYDSLILATGATPIRPTLPGIDDPDILPLWTMADMDRILARIDEGARRAVIVGAGFIGLEVAENLRERGLDVEIVELMPGVLPALDPEMAHPLADELRRCGVGLHLGRKVVSFERADAGEEEKAAGALAAHLDDGSSLAADLVVLSIGVRPNSELAADADLPLTECGGIVTDEHMRTADPSIYAVGDAAAVRDLVSDAPAQIPLAGPANRQARIAADNIMGIESVYRGSLGTSIVKVFSLAAGSVGHSERRLKAAGRAYRKLYLHPPSHAWYYPGAQQMALKLLYNDEGRILGFQAVGAEGIDKRVDVVAAAMRNGLTVRDLAEMELAYAPPFGSAKDPVNFAGMVACNALDGLTDIVHADALPSDALLLDVREPAETAAGMIPGAVNIPLGQVRGRLAELPRDKRIVVYCRVGIRGYVAERILKQNGLSAANLSGGILAWRLFHPDPVTRKRSAPPPKRAASAQADMCEPCRSFDEDGVEISLGKRADREGRP